MFSKLSQRQLRRIGRPNDGPRENEIRAVPTLNHRKMKDRKKARTRGLQISAPFTSGKHGGGPKALAGTSSGGPKDPGAPIPAAATPGASMPAGSTTTCDLHDKRRRTQWKERGRDRPGIERNERERKTCRYGGCL